jgi:phosphoglycolate phosphatase
MDFTRQLKLLVFDLDGTLADTRLDLAHSVNSVLASLGKKTLAIETIVSFVGDGAEDLLRRSLHAAGCGAEEVEAELPRVLALFLEHYQRHCLDYSHPYAGAVVLLEQMHGYRKAILTNKPLGPALHLLQGLGMKRHFDLIVGGDGPHGKKPDPRGLAYILSTLKTFPNQAVLIGDSVQDLRTAQAADCAFIGFLGGMGDPKSLLAESPAFSAHHLDQIPAMLADIERKLRSEHA